MGRVSGAIAGMVCACCAAAAFAAPPRLFAQSKPSTSGWQLPAEADTLKNPLTVDAKVLAGGKTLFKDKCERCHGPAGLGDGPDADPDAMMDMDLTVAKRAERNPDGVVFYKIMNGRRKPKMPAFKEEISSDQAWAIVAYVQTLRKTK